MSIIDGMVTYCIGSARQKRDYFADSSGIVLLDNVEVLFCASENGRNYFAYGDVPFAAFTVAEYLKYRRALCGSDISPDKLKELGISPDKRLKKLSPVQMRTVMFLEKTAGVTAKTLVVNLDGAKYTKRENARLYRLLECVSDAYVCVTDERFVKHAATNAKTLSFGKKPDRIRPAFYTARRLAKRIGAKRVAVM